MKNNFCVVCNKKFESFSVGGLLDNSNKKICNDCLDELNPIYKEFTQKNIKITAIYDYNSKIRELIYLFKGCYDYELSNVFLEPIILYLKLRYRGYQIVCVPSTENDDKKRGYNHVEEVFKKLGFPLIKLIYKNVDFKQSDLSYKNRLNSIKNFSLISNQNLSNKKILLVDDIFTSGTTIEACYDLIKKLSPKNIKVLVLAKTISKT